MADFTNKAALGTSRVNPSSMVPGSTGNAPQSGIATQKGTIEALLRNNPSLANGGRVAEMPRVGAVPNASMQNPLQQNLPLSAAKPMGNAQQTQTPLVKLPMSPNAGIPTGPMDTLHPRVSSAKGGPTPMQYPETSGSNWWDKYGNGQQTGAEEQSNGFLGSWAMDNTPLRRRQAELPVEKQQMLGVQNPKKTARAMKPEDFAMLASVFKTLGEQ